MSTSTPAAVAAGLGDLVRSIEGDATVPVTGLAYDSRSVSPGDLFFCVPGARSDGHAFAPAAVAAGAAAVCIEQPVEVDVPKIVVSDVRTALALAAAGFFGHPSRDLMVAGITGTNGKTTTAFLLDAIFRASGHTTGLIGTVETRVAGAARSGTRTTPESLDLQRLLAEMREAGVSAVAMEVTSHALTLNRVDGVRFATAVFTNLTQDHLDWHGDMDSYFAAKASLFDPARSASAAVNADDAYGRRLLGDLRMPCLTFGTSPGCDVSARGVTSGPHGSDFDLATPEGGARVHTPLVGAYNVSNCLAAAAAAVSCGISARDIAAGLQSLDSVPGRLERVDAGQAFLVVVDYAHTPDSLENVLREARGLGECVVCVFGCGGDRDRGKRPLMGAAAARWADVVVVTSDNPRSEDPSSIVSEIVRGVLDLRPGGPDAVLVDRTDAIRFALHEARPGDVVVIAGKGHESGQEFATRTIPYDDREVARSLLAEMSAGEGVRP